MESEKSRIPVYQCQQPTDIGVLKDTQNTKKQALGKATDPDPLKCPDFTFGANPPACVVFGGTNQRPMKSTKKVAAAAAAPPPSKKTAAAPVRSTISKYRGEADLRNKNKVLETIKCELSSKVAEMQSAIEEMKEQNDNLEKENQKLKKFQESCMLILETRNCDPVTGNSILEEEEENKKRRAENMVLTEELNAGLELFSQMVKEQKCNLQNTETKWKQVEEERVHFREQQQSFHREMEELSALLDEEEKDALSALLDDDEEEKDALLNL